MDFSKLTDRKRYEIMPSELVTDPPMWHIEQPSVGHFSLKYRNGYLYIDPIKIIIGSAGYGRDSGTVYKLLLKKPMSDEHIKHVVEKYDINIDFYDIRTYKPVDLFFLYFMEELLGPIVEYQAPFYDYGPPPANGPAAEEYRNRSQANDNFWNSLFKQIKIVSRKHEPLFRQPTEEEEMAQAIARAKKGAIKHREAQEKMRELMRSPEAESIRLREEEMAQAIDRATKDAIKHREAREKMRSPKADPIAEHILKAGRRKSRKSKKPI